MSEFRTVKKKRDKKTPEESLNTYQWDVFICHASEDKEPFVKELVEKLREIGLSVWYDEFTLKIGDSLRRSIDKGLNRSRYGIVVLSRSFFNKEWPQRELDGLAIREYGGSKVILPIWLNIEHEDVARYSPTLADRVATKAIDGMDKVVNKIVSVIKPDLASISNQRIINNLLKNRLDNISAVRNIISDIGQFDIDIKEQYNWLTDFTLVMDAKHGDEIIAVSSENIEDLMEKQRDRMQYLQAISRAVSSGVQVRQLFLIDDDFIGRQDIIFVIKTYQEYFGQNAVKWLRLSDVKEGCWPLDYVIFAKTVMIRPRFHFNIVEISIEPEKIADAYQVFEQLWENSRYNLPAT